MLIGKSTGCALQLHGVLRPRQLDKEVTAGHPRLMSMPMLQQAEGLAHLLAEAAAELLQGGGDVVHAGVQDRLHHDFKVLSLLAGEVLQGRQACRQHGHLLDIPAYTAAQLQQAHKTSLSRGQSCVKCWLQMAGQQQLARVQS